MTDRNKDFVHYTHAYLRINTNTLNDYITASAGYINLTIIEERQLNVAQMDVFGRLMMDRTIFLGTEVNDYTTNVIQAQLLYLDNVDPSKDISIYINSPGGSVYAGFGVYDTIRYVGCDASTMCTGMAASMTAVLFVAGAGGKRYTLPHPRVMIHQPMGGMQGQASGIEIATKEVLRVKAKFYKIIANHSGRSVEKIERDNDCDKWMTASEALEYGMIDKVFTSTKQTAKEKKADGEEKQFDRASMLLLQSS